MKTLSSKHKKAAATQSLKCFKCHKLGHTKRNCHGKPKKEKSPVATTKDEESWLYPEESENICLMGRGASCSDESKASTFEKEESSSESDRNFLVTECNGRMPPDTRRTLPASMLFHQEPFIHAVYPHPGVFLPDIMEQTCASQYMEIQNLAIENQRLVATHSALRHEFAAAQHELQNLQVLMMSGKSKHEHQIRPILDKIAKMEAGLKASASIKVELQQARVEAQSLTVTRQVLISNVQQLTQDLQKSHTDVQQISSLVSELDALRQEYQSCRATYEYERKLRVDHYELLQVMEKNYGAMVGEVENLRRGLLNATKVDKTGGPYGSNAGYKKNDTSEQHALGQSEISHVHQDLQKSDADVQHVSSLVSELDALKQEYQSCRATYEYERKLHVDHYELLQVMEKNYDSMVGEVENLRRGLLNATNLDKIGGPYGTNIGYQENDTSEQHALGQSAYEEICHVHQGIGASHPTPATAAWPGYQPTLIKAAYEAPRSAFYGASQGTPVSAIYDATAIPHYDMSRTPSYDHLGGFPEYVGGGAPVAVSSANPSSIYAAGGQPPQSHASLQLPPAYGAFQVQIAYGVPQTSTRPEVPATQARR